MNPHRVWVIGAVHQGIPDGFLPDGHKMFKRVRDKGVQNIPYEMRSHPSFQPFIAQYGEDPRHQLLESIVSQSGWL